MLKNDFVHLPALKDSEMLQAEQISGQTANLNERLVS